MSTNISHQVKLINDAIHESARFMQRDFGEIVQLQNSKRGVSDFTHKCYSRLQNKLISALDQRRPNYGIILANETTPKDEYFFCIEPISGIDNFQKAIPFCAIAIALFKQEKGIIEPQALSIHNPILRETFYCGKGIGSWFENYNETNVPKSRMRVSKQGDVVNAITSAPFEIDLTLSRRLGSSLLEMAYLSCGRLDLVIHKAESLLTQAAFLMVREAGGHAEEKDNKYFACNNNLLKSASEVFNKHYYADE